MALRALHRLRRSPAPALFGAGEERSGGALDLWAQRRVALDAADQQGLGEQDADAGGVGREGAFREAAPAGGGMRRVEDNEGGGAGEDGSNARPAPSITLWPKPVRKAIHRWMRSIRRTGGAASGIASVARK